MVIKEWMYLWGGRSGGGGGGGGGGGTSSGSGSKSRKKGNKFSSTGDIDKENITTTTTPGCINAVFQLFDFHPSHFSNNLHHYHSSLPQEPVIPVKEAPRNSLEIYDGTNFVEAATLSSAANMKKDQTFNYRDMKIKTRSCSRRDANLSTTESSSSINSPASAMGTKTPTLVARLMGLDLLPETSSPRPSSSLSTSSPKDSANHVQPLQNRSKSKRQAIPSYVNDNDFISRSLPETPRTSSTSARRSDVDIQRFSLQINKENNGLTDSITSREFNFSKFLTSKINARGNKCGDDENMRRPGEYAKEIVKEFKESISSRRVVGRDITNTTTNLTDHHRQRQDQDVVLLTSKKPSNLGKINVSHNSCKTFEAKSNQSEHGTVSSKFKVQDGKPRQNSLSIQDAQVICDYRNQMRCGLLKQTPSTWDLIRNKQDNPFVRSAALTTSTRAFPHSENNKCKRTPLSSPPATSLLKKQGVQKQKQWVASYHALPSKKNRTTTTRSSCNQSHSDKKHPMTINHTSTALVATSKQITDYISRILTCTNIHNHTPISSFKLNSPSHPLNQPTLHLLPKLRQGKLIFNLVNQPLAQILTSNHNFVGDEKLMFGEERDGIVMEIEDYIVKKLVHETVLLHVGVRT